MAKLATSAAAGPTKAQVTCRSIAELRTISSTAAMSSLTRAGLTMNPGIPAGPAEIKRMVSRPDGQSPQSVRSGAGVFADQSGSPPRRRNHDQVVPPLSHQRRIWPAIKASGGWRNSIGYLSRLHWPEVASPSDDASAPVANWRQRPSISPAGTRLRWPILALSPDSRLPHSGWGGLFRSVRGGHRNGVRAGPGVGPRAPAARYRAPG